jgi:dTDP-4-amino-4,6-dideoxygalactose transaminase
MIQLFNIPQYKIDTSNFSNLLHDKVVVDFEKKFADYVGAKYSVGVNSATSGIFLMLLNVSNKNVRVPSIIPPVVPNAVLHAGCNVEFYDDIDWVGNSYLLHETDKYKIIDSAQKVEQNQFKKEANPNDLMIFSFYPTKPIGSSDGGIIVSDDYDKIEYIRELTMNGMTYADNNWERVQKSIGYKMYLNSIQAYICNENFKKLEIKNKKIQEIRDLYNNSFNLKNTSNHLYRIRVEDNKRFISDAKENGIVCGIHYEAAHLNPVFNSTNLKLEKSEIEAKRTVSIPLHENLSKEDVDKIINYAKNKIQ